MGNNIGNNRINCAGSDCVACGIENVKKEEMESNSKGWIIINENHPNNPNKKIIFNDTFSYTRKECISKFLRYTGSDWRYWYRKYNFRAVKAEMSIKLSMNTK